MSESNGRRSQEVVAALRGTYAAAHRSKVFLINEVFVQDAGQNGVKRTASLRSYRRYLERVRSGKANGPITPAKEREAVAQAREMLRDAEDLIVTTLGLVRHVRHSGIVEDVMEVWRSALKQSGPAPLLELWTTVLDFETVRDSLAELGLDADALDELTQSTEQLNAELIAADDTIAIRFGAKGRVANLSTSLRKPVRSVTDLLTANAFDATVDLLSHSKLAMAEASGASFGASRDPGDDQFDPFDLVLTTALLARSELLRHTRRLEDTGIAAYEGRGAGAVFVIALIVVLIAAILAKKYCDKPSGADEVGLCIALGLLWLVSMGFMIKEVCDPDSGSPCKSTQAIILTHANPSLSGVA